MRKLIISFWILMIFAMSMLLWQCYANNQHMNQEATDHPQQQHFWFTNSAAVNPAAPAPMQHNGPDVEQTAYLVQENTPTSVTFTCHVTLTNKGNAKAVNVQVAVRPYRGTRTDDEDVGRNVATITTLDDNDPRSQLSQWVSFPDLAPGESSTQTAVFLSRNDLNPGSNPKPQIVFEPERKAAPTAQH